MFVYELTIIKGMQGGIIICHCYNYSLFVMIYLSLMIYQMVL